MGEVIRPPVFARPAPRSPQARRKQSRRMLDGRLAFIAVAMIALGMILAIAGAAFAVRALVVFCFATLAGRARRVGVQRTQPG